MPRFTFETLAFPAPFFLPTEKLMLHEEQAGKLFLLMLVLYNWTTKYSTFCLTSQPSEFFFCCIAFIFWTYSILLAQGIKIIKESEWQKSRKQMTLEHLSLIFEELGEPQTYFWICLCWLCSCVRVFPKNPKETNSLFCLLFVEEAKKKKMEYQIQLLKKLRYL